VEFEIVGNPNANLLANQCTIFKVYSFSHSGNILGQIENLNGSHDHNHAPFRDGLSWGGAGTSYD